MTTESDTQLFAALFRGRSDAYGLETGGCQRTGKNFDWSRAVRGHLDGSGEPIGSYPMVPWLNDDNSVTWVVQWGCVDFDVKSNTKPSGDYELEDDAHVAAVNLSRVLEALGISSWIEITRSRGRHVWVFCKDWVNAADMRHALLVACQIAEVSIREVNPKQEELSLGQLGNYVRLPYPGGMEGHLGSRYMVDEDYTPWGWAEFAHSAADTINAPDDLARVAQHYTPPPPPIPLAPPPSGRRLTEVHRRLNGLAHVMLEEGPIGGDRSAYLYKLAVVCKQSNLSLSEACAIVGEADLRHTHKYVGRNDFEHIIETTVRNAYDRS